MTEDTPTPPPAASDAILLPCPFCGGEAERVDNGPTQTQVAYAYSWGDDVDDGGSFIHCKRCDASSPIHYDRKEHLISSWNERQITAEMVERALDAWFDDDGAWKRESERVKGIDQERFAESMRTEMRIALSAALSPGNAMTEAASDAIEAAMDVIVHAIACKESFGPDDMRSAIAAYHAALPSEFGETNTLIDERTRLQDEVKYWKAVSVWMADVIAATAGHQVMLKSVGKNEKERQIRIAAMSAASLEGGNMPSPRPIETVTKRLRDISDTRQQNTVGHEAAHEAAIREVK